MEPKCAPILLFCYKRLDTLILTVEALRNNYLAAQSDLIVFSDASKDVNDSVQVNSVRSYIGKISGFRSVRVINSTNNKGLANSIIGGVTAMLQEYEQVIVLEDDLVTTPNFLDFMNSSLVAYATNSDVFSVSAYSFNLNLNSDQNDVYFLNRGWSWGWGTWRSRWENVDWEVNEFSNFRKSWKRKLEFAKGGSDLNAMLKKQMDGNLDSWAIRWFFNQYLIGGLTVYPVASLVNNIGFGEDATHTTGSNKRYRPRLNDGINRSFDLPETVELSKRPHKAFLKKMGYVSRIQSRIFNYFRNV